jgi:guanine deaminase
MGKELYVGTFVHSLSLNQLEIGENGVIGVEDGKIAFVEKNVKDLEAVKKAHNFEGAKVTRPQRVPRSLTDN